MKNEDTTLMERLRPAIQHLILQEVRLLRLEQTLSSPFVIQEMGRSILEAKRQIVDLTRSMETEKREQLIKQIIDESAEEEIDLTLQIRKNRCLRCIHVRYVDETGKDHFNLPLRAQRAEALGCDKMPAPGPQCTHYRQRLRTASLRDTLDEMHFLYEVKEMFDRFEEIWQDYFLER
jgi:hypothetical protein